MKGISPIAFMLLCLFCSCLESGDDETLDLESPVITAIGGSQVIAPDHFTEVSAESSIIPLAFQVEDATGISEIVIDVHNGFDGHTHGRVYNANNFILLNYNHTISHSELDDPTSFQSGLDDNLSVYLNETNPLIPAGGLILAGPYHFSIKAADMEGNETSYADNTTYHTTLYVQRDYAPQIGVNVLDPTSGTVSGSVWRNMDHSSSSDIIFLWIYIVSPNPANPAQEGEIQAEWIWGQSNWPHQFRPDGGLDLTNKQEINLFELLTGQEAIRQMSGSEVLTVWAEDANGNISVRRF
ncbi:MAG: DUF4625 domain-containing protein [Cyclobacteriaceae bacterium]|nr:DUF4625 domain-containing protein [Cyclobacteriaceae bacterium HetDA_MAG_MS6]